MKRHRNRARSRGIKSALFTKTLLATCYNNGPLVTAASNRWLSPKASFYSSSHDDDTNHPSCNPRKRERIKHHDDDDFSRFLQCALECRGGNYSAMNDMSSSHPETENNPRAADVVYAHSSCNNNHQIVDVSNSSNNVTSNNQEVIYDNNDQLDVLDSSLQNETEPIIISPSIQQTQQQPQRQQRQRLVLEFDTQAINSDKYGNTIRSRIRSRMGNENDWDRITRQQRRGAALSISLDLSPSSGCSSSSGVGGVNYNNIDRGLTLSAASGSVNNRINGNTAATTATTSTNNNNLSIIHTLLTTTTTILQHSTLLLPPLLLTRRILNATRNAIVDYFRGRIFRQTFTRMERAYLRYYEFPAAIRAVARLASQLGILLGLSVVVRWWMFMVLAGDVVGPLVLGMSGMDIRQDIGMVGTSGGGGGGLMKDKNLESILGNVCNVGLPCYQRGRGMAWLCGLIWIGAVVGTGHACTVALSVWGGPLRLQAIQVQAEKPKQLLLRAVHHPITWIRELEEWKHLPNLQSNGSRRDGARRRRGRSDGNRVLDLDPLLFPATWLPLRWIQIFAVTKAFSTDPQNYRWCSPENDRIVIPKLMKQYLIQLALGDEWQRVFLGEKRVGLGIVVVISYFIALVWMVFTAFTLDGGSAAMLIPSVLAAIISGGINVMLFWNRLTTRSQKKALAAIGLA